MQLVEYVAYTWFHVLRTQFFLHPATCDTFRGRMRVDVRMRRDMGGYRYISFHNFDIRPIFYFPDEGCRGEGTRSDTHRAQCPKEASMGEAKQKKKGVLAQYTHGKVAC